MLFYSLGGGESCRCERCTCFVPARQGIDLSLGPGSITTERQAANINNFLCVTGPGRFLFALRRGVLTSLPPGAGTAVLPYAKCHTMLIVICGNGFGPKDGEVRTVLPFANCGI